MTQTDIKINIKAIADLTGIKITEAEMQKLGGDINAVQAKLAALGRTDLAAGAVKQVIGTSRANTRIANQSLIDSVLGLGGGATSIAPANGSWLRSMKKSIGEESDLGALSNIARGGAVTIIASQVQKLTGTMRELRDGTKQWSDVLASIPVFGVGWQIGSDLRELITGEKAAVEEAEKLAKASQKAAEGFRAIRTYIAELNKENAQQGQGLWGDLVNTWGSDQQKTAWKYRQQMLTQEQDANENARKQYEDYEKSQKPKGDALKSAYDKSVANGDLQTTIDENRKKYNEWVQQYNAGLQVIDAATARRKKQIDAYALGGEANENISKVYQGWKNIIGGLVGGVQDKYSDLAENAKRENERTAKRGPNDIPFGDTVSLAERERQNAREMAKMQLADLERYRIGAGPVTQGETRLITGIEGDAYKSQSLTLAREQKRLVEKMGTDTRRLAEKFAEFVLSAQSYISKAESFMDQLAGAK